ncbi:MAG TPA: type II toxin-antitoxin system RelE/ParE family toxin [Rhizobiaceae bacterium]|nr:type II toxin-antitoxin system RelE/ParE family toxin [Rhizobiaceae bacterium]
MPKKTSSTFGRGLPTTGFRLRTRCSTASKRNGFLLAEHPLSGPARDDILIGIRQQVSGNYVTFYRVLDECLEIVRVLHGRRKILPDMESLLNEGE